MSQVILLQIGRCGNRIGEQFWKQVLNEHRITADGLFKGEPTTGTDIYFEEFKKSYIPRCLQLDFGTECIDGIVNGPLGKLYAMENQIQGTVEVDGTWAKGMYLANAEVDLALEIVRRLFERCECATGVQFLHSLTGRVGSGFGCNLLSKCLEQYPDRMFQTITHMPSQQTSNNVIELYNTVLSIHHLVENASITNYFQNQSLKRICLKESGLRQPQFCDMNKIIAKVVAGTTVSMRFPGSQNTSIRKIALNMIPFPRLHFFAAGVSPIGRRRGNTVRDLIDTAYNREALVSERDWQQGRFFATTNLFTGPLCTSQIQTLLFSHKQKNQAKYVQWIADQNHYSLTESLPDPSLITLMNTSSVQILFKNYAERFTAMFRRKAFLYHYTKHGMDEMEFTEAESNMNDLVSQFPENNCCCCGDWDDFEEEEEAE